MDYRIKIAILIAAMVLLLGLLFVALLVVSRVASRKRSGGGGVEPALELAGMILLIGLGLWALTPAWKWLIEWVRLQ